MAKLLDQLRLKYEIDKDGDFRVVFKIDDTRSQMVTIESDSRRVEELEIRGVWSIGLDSETMFEADVANALLVYNSIAEIGAWQTIHREDDSCTAIFLATIAANTTARSLQTVMHAVALAADDVEAKLTGGDIF